MYPTGQVREAQPDWLTVGSHRATNVRAMSDLANALALAEEADGNKRRPWRLLAYDGYRCGRVRYGECRGWGLMQLSGDSARAFLAPALDCADSVSRLDLAVTYQTDRPFPEAGRVLYEQATDWRVTHPKAAAAWYIGGDDTGWTTYIGQRQSDAFFRCYDKGAESRSAGDESEQRQYANAWRYELELKGESAHATAQRVLGADNLSVACQSLVYGWLASRGVTPPWRVSDPIRPSGTLRRRSDRDTKLAWLLGQVRPTVEWLVANGAQDSVLASLGLDRVVAATTSDLVQTSED